jgi:hypothetical protein
MARYTSIIHCGSSNFQTDFVAPKSQVLVDFAESCLNRQALWAHLFEEKSGRVVASYSHAGGVQKAQ